MGCSCKKSKRYNDKILNYICIQILGIVFVLVGFAASLNSYFLSALFFNHPMVWGINLLEASSYGIISGMLCVFIGFAIIVGAKYPKENGKNA